MPTVRCEASCNLDKVTAFDTSATGIGSRIDARRGQVYADMGDRANGIFALENAIRLDLEPELRKEAETLIEQLKRQHT